MLEERRHGYSEVVRHKGFDPDEPRDEQGQWTDGGGGSASDSGGGGGPPRARSADEAQRVAAQAAGGYAPLAGLPQKPIKVGDEWYVPGPIGAVKAAAETYMKLAGMSYEPPKAYLKVDKERAGRIASEFEAMKHDPSDPATKTSYAALAKEVAGQWQSVKSTGLKIEFIKEGQEDPYKTSLRMAAMDVIHNNHLWVFPTTLGFGSGTEGAAAAKNDNPMLQETGEVVDGHKLLVNDQFRIVHDYFGHFKEGVGFRADGEENAWRSHAAMFTPLARAALTSETRGQNSWLNFGPEAEHNRTASPADTIYAPQKIGIMAGWASEEGRRDPATKGYGGAGLERGGGKDRPGRGAVSYSYISLRQAAEVLDAETYRKFADVAYRFFSATGELTRLDEVMIAVRAREPREDTEIELWPEEDENEDDFMDRCVGELTVCIGDRADSVCAEKWDASQELGKKGFVTLSMLSGDLAIAPCGTSCLGCRGRGLDDEVAPLYVHRDLQNVEAFTAWAQAQGFDEVVDDPHVTVLYSKTAVDWSDMGRGSAAVVVLPGGARKIEQLGDEGAVVLRFESKALAQRHDEMVENGASHDYDSYVPHVTINLSGVIPDGAVPYDGELIFGPEIFETIDVKTKEFDESKHPRVPAGSPEGGQFGEGGGGGGGGGGDGAPSAAASNYGLVPGDVAKFKALKAEWATVNNELLEHVDDPDGPETTQKLFQLEAIVKEMHGLHADPGGPGGIGLPGGPRDVVVVGAGPGGLAASISGAAEGLDTLVVEANVVAGGQAKFSSRIENFPGFPVGVTGERLTQDMFTQAQRLGAEATLGVRVTGMTYDASTGLKHITLSNGEQIDSRTVILAGGVEFRRIPFTGSEGSGVIVGDGKALAKAAAGGPIVVVGGSNGAAQAALGAAAKSTHVYLLARSPIVDSMSDYQVTALRANPKVTVIESDSIAKLWRDEHGDPEKVETVGGKIFPAKAVGIFAGSVPETKWVPAAITRDKGGRLHTNKDLETELPGVYAVGDMREGAIGRVGVAVGEGQLSLRQANMFLTAQQEAAAAKAASAPKKIPKKKPSTKLITDLFDLDRANPWFGQTVENVTPLKKKKRKPRGKAAFDPDEPRDEHGRWTDGGGGVEPEAPGGGVEKPLLISERPGQEKIDVWNKQLTDRQEVLNQAGQTGEHEDDQLNGMQMALSAYSQEDQKHLDEGRSGINVRYDLDSKLLAAAYTDIIKKPAGDVAKIAYFGALDAAAHLKVLADLDARFGGKVRSIEVQRWKDDSSLSLWEQGGFKQREGQAGLTNLSAVMLEKKFGSTANAPDFENVPVPVQLSEGVGTDFQSEIRSAIDSIPPRAMKTMAEGGISFRVGQRMTELNPELKGVHPRGWSAGTTWDSAEGMFSHSQKAVNITEFYRPIGKKEFVRNSRARGVMLHESGHAFDYALGAPSANSSAFIYAYTVDRKAVPKEARGSLRYFLQKGKAGRSEAFAEIFGWYIGSGSGRQDIRKYFPKTSELVKQSMIRGLWLEPIA